MNGTVLILALALAGPGAMAAAQEDGRLAVIETAHGKIVIEFFPGDAPNHVENFVGFAGSGFYDGTAFHRIIPGFMIQGGDINTIDGEPKTWGSGDSGVVVDAEFNSIMHERGIVSMARSALPNSAGSQFFIVHDASSHLDGQYTVFGRIVTEASFETLDAIAGLETGERGAPADLEQARISSVTLVERSEVPDLLDLPEPARCPDCLKAPTYDSPEHGISFMAPQGWYFPAVPDQQNAPDAVMLGPKTGLVDPSISLTVQVHESTFDEIVAERDAAVEAFEENGYRITSRERGELGGLPTYTLDTRGPITLTGLTFTVRIQETTIYREDRAYTLRYANDVLEYEKLFADFETVLGSLEIREPAAPVEILGELPMPDDDAAQGGCLIATAAFGSELAPQVQQLRELRDRTVLSTQSGSAFMSAFNQFYYSFSPHVADLEREHPAFRDAVRALITPMLATLSLLNHAGIDSEAEMITYGTAVLLLNAGIYVAAPAVAARGIKRMLT